MGVHTYCVFTSVFVWTCMLGSACKMAVYFGVGVCQYMLGMDIRGACD